MKRKKLIICGQTTSKRIKKTVVDKIISRVLRGYSLFITGVAGTGKSYLIRKLTKLLIQNEQNVSTTAFTGVASINIKGITLHLFAGIGIEKEFESMLYKVRKNKRAKNNWKKCDVLIIDEVSMVGKKLFNNLNQIAQVIRKSNEFFGGIQLVLVGDFFQLPPIDDDWLFKSNMFLDNVSHYFELTKNYRQKDKNFRKVLEEVRYGKLSENTIKLLMLKTQMNKKIKGNPIILYSTRINVNNENEKELRKINYQIREFKCKDKMTGKFITDLDNPTTKFEKFCKLILNKGRFKEVLRLKKGAQVILLKNRGDNLVNGSKGIVMGFSYDEDDKLYPVVKFDNYDEQIIIKEESIEVRLNLSNGTVELTRVQIPLLLAWALTIHKCQGLTLENVEISMEDMFADGQFYVALSRVRSLDGVFLRNFDEKKIKTNMDVINFYSEKLKKK